MADNVPITAGTGTNIATDDVSGVHFQQVKLVDGTLDSSTAIVAGGGVEASALRVTIASDSTGVLSVDDNGGSLTVDVGTALPAGDNNIGNVDIASSVALDVSAATVTVTGTVTANAGTGTFTVDGSGVTQPVSAVSLPLPTGAATSANQLPDGHNVTVDNAAGASAVNIQDGGNSITVDGTVTATGPLTDSELRATAVPVSGTVTANLGTIAGVATETTLSTLNGKVTACDTGSVVIASGTVTNLSQLGGTAIAMNTGVRSAGTQRVTIATDDVVPASQSGTWNITNVSGTVSLPTGAATESTLSTLNGKVTACNTGAVVMSSGTLTTVSTVTNLSQLGGTAIAMNTGTRSAGTQRVTIATDDIVPTSQSGTWTVQPGNTANTTPWLTSQTPVTTGGLTTYHLVSAASTNATNVKASAGQLYGYYVYNNNASARKLAFHNTSGTPTAGASVFFTIVLPPTSGANVAFPSGISFSSGIAITTVTGLADSDATAVGANDLNINLFYK